MACIASDSASMASMASSDCSTPDQFGPTEYDPLLSPIGTLHILFLDNLFLSRIDAFVSCEMFFSSSNRLRGIKIN